jgi:hypothetical protein
MQMKKNGGNSDQKPLRYFTGKVAFSCATESSFVVYIRKDQKSGFCHSR